MEAVARYGRSRVVTGRRIAWYDDCIRERSDGYGDKQERIKLDQMMKVLFQLSKRTMLSLINELFGENFISRDVELSYGNPVFVQDDYRRVVGDVVLKVRVKPGARGGKAQDGVYYYHIEFQTLNDTSMAIRLFRYGFEQAVEQAVAGEEKQGNEGGPILSFPKQLVIFLEENNQIPDELRLQLRLPDGELVPYRVPVMKYWQTTAKELQRRGLYALLPLQAFKVRKRIQAIERSAKSEAEQGKLIAEQFVLLRELVAETIEALRELHNQRRLPLGDLERILRVLQNINTYMYGKYGQYKPVEEEAMHMIRSLYDPRVKEEGRREGFEQGIEQGIEQGVRLVARRLLEDGFAAEEVARMTGLSPAQVAELHKGQ